MRTRFARLRMVWISRNYSLLVSNLFGTLLVGLATACWIAFLWVSVK